LLEASVDKEKLETAVSNVLDNAIKASQQGAVTLGAAFDTARKGVVISVTDTGTGMSQKMARMAFKKFTRPEAPAERASGGTGIGLYVSSVLLRGMGGAIWVERTAPEKGTVVCLLVPVSPTGKCVPRPRRTSH
jgi:signal transduction histidine kinase